jgi:hypothetical protein
MPGFQDPLQGVRTIGGIPLANLVDDAIIGIVVERDGP